MLILSQSPWIGPNRFFSWGTVYWSSYNKFWVKKKKESYGKFWEHIYFFASSSYIYTYVIHICVYVLLWLCWIFYLACALSLAVARGGFSSRRARAPDQAGMVVATCRLNCSTAYGVLAPQPGIEPTPSALQGHILNHWATREVPESSYSDSV